MEPIPPAPPLPRTEPRGIARPLWAVPLLVVGFGVLAWVVVARPFLNSPERQPARDLAAARTLLARADGDPVEAENLVRSALEHPEYLPGRVGEAKFLLGSAEARHAQQAASEASPALWLAALRDLTDAEKQGVPEDDQLKLTYQLGKVAFNSRGDPRHVVDLLQRSAAEADDRAEAYQLLTLAYLRLPEPDLQKALEANEQLRQVAVDDQLATARFLGGELYLKLQRPEDARKVLERIAPPAPPALVSKARLLRARSLEEDERWAEAAALWQTLSTDKNQSDVRPGAMLYHLGLCYRQLEQVREAANIWEQCLAKAGDGDEGPASALALAELSLRESVIDKALDLFAQAVAKTDAPPAWANTLVDRGHALAVFERAATLLRQMGLYEASLKLAASYERLAGPVKANVLRGEVYSAWARAGEKLQADRDPAAPTPEVVNERFRQAGLAYVTAAAQAAEVTEKADYLWLATQRYLGGQDRVQAAAAFEKLYRVAPRSPHLGEGWYRLGEAHRLAKDIPTAEAAYNEAIKFPTGFAYRARYQRAVFAWERGEVDDAELDLEQNLKLLRFDRDDEAQEKSLFAIGELFFKRGNNAMAARHLEEALEKFPDNPEAVRARFHLAQSYQEMAGQKNFNVLLKSYKNPETIEHFANENKRLLQRAADEFEKLMPLLEKTKAGTQGEKPDGAAQLTREDLIKAAFKAADCRYYAGQYLESLQLYERLADGLSKQPLTPEDQLTYLLVLGGNVRCLTVLIGSKADYRDKLRQRLTEIQMVIQDMDEKTRMDWEDWIRKPKEVAEGKTP